MKFKVISVLAEGGDRLKTPLGDAVDSEIQKFLVSDECGELKDVRVEAAFGMGAFGRALVILSYEPKEKQEGDEDKSKSKKTR